MHEYLIYDTSKAPNISRRGVRFRSKQNFRRPIPSRRHTFRKYRRGLILISDGPNESKIAQLDSAITVNKDIARFKIPMNNPTFMQVFQYKHYLRDVILNRVQRKFFYNIIVEPRLLIKSCKVPPEQYWSSKYTLSKSWKLLISLTMRGLSRCCRISFSIST